MFHWDNEELDVQDSEKSRVRISKLPHIGRLLVEHHAAEQEEEQESAHLDQESNPR